ncbi:LuxR C-terminal-related transcriptional regulator [Bradyrhizobium sp. CCGUVB1N3]|uniref:LuxR C-terminal-related transcriptional regulator n=1 Tax=Bradyrhizobium sp. CCGUVB1N3 TaxID=2949629 RepID=UPI0020B17F85|nr:LuxR C-terminal-related transcriptional regulator [Bradyrhizobium sp. CCGUVB1N3]MCP3473907.1 LuxR C-terminal-related transcriptional regulator [Bradyrhizobium sp. CCGUVB1N3]
MIDRFYNAALNPEMWPSAFDAYARVTGGVGAALFSPDSPDLDMAYASAALTNAVSQYGLGWHAICPRTQVGMSPAMSDRIWSDEEIFSEEQVRRSQFHQEFLQGYGFGSHLSLTSLQIVPGSTFFLASQRSISAGAASAEERHAANVLSSHAVRALQVYRGLVRPSVSRDLLADVLAHLPSGVIVTDPDGRVVFMNRSAEALKGDGLRVDRGQLLASMPRDQAKLPRLIKATLTPGASPADARPIGLQRPSLKKPLLLRAIPIRARSDQPLPRILRGLDLVLITISDPEGARPEIPLEALEAFGLTPSEAAVAAMLGTGCSPGEIAEARKISVSTVRTHIRRIYGKLQVTRQGELAKIVSALKPPI